jgi:hypothetical protein
MSTKRSFWEDLEDVIRNVPTNEKPFIEGDLNSHVILKKGLSRCMKASGMGTNHEVKDILNFAVVYDLSITNTFFRKSQSHFPYLDCKVIPEDCAWHNIR